MLLIRSPSWGALLAQKAPIYTPKIHLGTHVGFPVVLKCTHGAPIFDPKIDFSALPSEGASRSVPRPCTKQAPATTPSGCVLNRFDVDVRWILRGCCTNFEDASSSLLICRFHRLFFSIFWERAVAECAQPSSPPTPRGVGVSEFRFRSLCFQCIQCPKCGTVLPIIC